MRIIMASLLLFSCYGVEPSGEVLGANGGEAPADRKDTVAAAEQGAVEEKTDAKSNYCKVSYRYYHGNVRSKNGRPFPIGVKMNLDPHDGCLATTAEICWSVTNNRGDGHGGGFLINLMTYSISASVATDYDSNRTEKRSLFAEFGDSDDAAMQVLAHQTGASWQIDSAKTSVRLTIDGTEFGLTEKGLMLTDRSKTCFDYSEKKRVGEPIQAK